MSARVESVTTDPISSDAGVSLDAGLSVRELAASKLVHIVVEASDDGKEWYVDQSATWVGPAENPVIEPVPVKGRQYRLTVTGDAIESAPIARAK